MHSLHARSSNSLRRGTFLLTPDEGACVLLHHPAPAPPGCHAWQRIRWRNKKHHGTDAANGDERPFDFSEAVVFIHGDGDLYARSAAAGWPEAGQSHRGGMGCLFSPAGRRWPEGPDEGGEAIEFTASRPSSPRMRSALLPAGEKRAYAAAFDPYLIAPYSDGRCPSGQGRRQQRMLPMRPLFELHDQFVHREAGAC